MKYPLYPKPKPLSGKQAKRVQEAIRTGKSLTIAAAERTIRRILARRKRQELLTHAPATSHTSAKRRASVQHD